MSDEKKIPTPQEFIAHLKEQIEIAEVRAKLQSLNTQIAKDRAEELNALMFIAQVTKDPESVNDEKETEEPSSKKRKLKSE